ncbi:MAG: response regulator, partial [Candidatus Methylomirabilis sp.]|nr:response regulator [Deltaproteobacteria bacterium]
MKILIAEDERVSRTKLQAVLKKRGFEVLAAADGAEAWRLWSADEDLQLAILDWMMPEMDGLEVCRKIRAHGEKSSRAYTYVLMLTGKNQKEDLIAAVEGGADAYMTKPF